MAPYIFMKYHKYPSIKPSNPQLYPKKKKPSNPTQASATPFLPINHCQSILLPLGLAFLRKRNSDCVKDKRRRGEGVDADKVKVLANRLVG